MEKRLYNKITKKKKKKKILRNSSQRGLMTEINVCKTIRQKVYAVFYDMKC